MKNLLSALFFFACIFFLSSGCSSTNAKLGSTENILEKAFSYCCDTGKVVTVLPLEHDEILVFYGGKKYRMNRAVSASGERYEGEGLEWWSKEAGAESVAFLATSGTGEIIANCSFSK